MFENNELPDRWTRVGLKDGDLYDVKDNFHSIVTIVDTPTKPWIYLTLISGGVVGLLIEQISSIIEMSPDSFYKAQVTCQLLENIKRKACKEHEEMSYE